MSFSWKKLDKAKALEVTLDTALKVLETTENVLNTTPIPGAAAVITVILEVVKRQERASNNARRTIEQQERWKKLVSQLEECETDPDSTPHDTLSKLREASRVLASELKDYARELREATTHELRPRWMTCGGDEEALQDFLRKSNEAIADYQYAQGRRIEECVLKIQRVVGDIDTKVDRIENTIQVDRDENKIKEFDRLIEKRRVALASYNAPRRVGTLSSCAEGTRLPLLQSISDWRKDPDADRVFWLKERAGFGKTAIALSVARQAEDEGTLAASFFFSYQIPELSNASRFLPTIIYQLCLFGGAPYKQRFVAAIAQHTSLLDANLKDQAQKLFLDPLDRLDSASSKTPIVIVIDALDECQHEDALDLTTFIASLSSLNLPLKVFITSRPELQITDPFLDLGVEPRDIVDTSNEDVETYLRAELAKIPSKPGIRALNLPRDWITEEDIQGLLARAGAVQVYSDSRSTEKGLFVYVATVTRFIGDKGSCDPQKHVRILLSDTPSGSPTRPYQGIDDLYTRVLDVALEGRGDLLQRFRVVVGGLIAVKRGALSIPAFENLLGIPQSEVRRTLVNLQSVIQYSDTDQTLPSFHHRSFTDFLTDKDRSGPRYYIYLKPHQKRLALGCLRVIAASPLKEEVTNAMKKDDYFFYPSAEPSPELKHATIQLSGYSKGLEGDEDLLEELEKFIKTDFGWWIETTLPTAGFTFYLTSEAADRQDERELPMLFRALVSSAGFHNVDARTHVHALVRKELRRYISAITQRQDNGSRMEAEAMIMSIKKHIHDLQEKVESSDGSLDLGDLRMACAAVLAFSRNAEATIDKYQLSIGKQEEVERNRKRTIFLRHQVKPLLIEGQYIPVNEPFEEHGIFTASVGEVDPRFYRIPDSDSDSDSDLDSNSDSEVDGGSE